MRLIDADALLEDFSERQNLDCSDGEFCDCFLNDSQEVSTEWWCVEDAVESAPTIDAAPVVHARWVRQDDTFTRFRCGNCKTENHHVMWRFCPLCGAKMDGGESDE